MVGMFSPGGCCCDPPVYANCDEVSECQDCAVFDENGIPVDSLPDVLTVGLSGAAGPGTGELEDFQCPESDDCNAILTSWECNRIGPCSWQSEPIQICVEEFFGCTIEFWMEVSLSGDNISHATLSAVLIQGGSCINNCSNTAVWQREIPYDTKCSPTDEFPTLLNCAAALGGSLTLTSSSDICACAVSASASVA